MEWVNGMEGASEYNKICKEINIAISQQTINQTKIYYHIHLYE